MSDPQVFFAGGKRGRPRLSREEPSADVHVTLPAGMYDAACLRARRERVSVPEIIRQALAGLLPRPLK